jgi:hypothetical protein
VNAVIPAEPQFMHWSEAAITWGREEHPRLMPSPGEYALVLDPVMCSNMHTYRFSCVLIDGGSSINLLYRSSMEKLGIPLAQLNRAGSPSMASCLGIHAPLWVGCSWRFSSGRKVTAATSPSSLRCWTSAVPITRCLAAQP